MCDVLCAVYNYPCCGGTLCVMYCVPSRVLLVLCDDEMETTVYSRTSL